MYRVNIMQPDMSSNRRLKFSLARLKSIYRRRTLSRDRQHFGITRGKTSIVGKYTQMRFRIVLHKPV